jgi:hypothetical protein
VGTGDFASPQPTTGTEKARRKARLFLCAVSGDATIFETSELFRENNPQSRHN